MICETQGGEPLPRLTWKRGQIVIDDVVEEIDTQNRVVRNYLKLPSLKRQDHDDVLACLASNTNLSVPLNTYININMVCKWFKKKLPYNFSLEMLSALRQKKVYVASMILSWDIK